MKYRGVLDVGARKPGQIMYEGPIRDASLAEVYSEWFTRYAGN